MLITTAHDGFNVFKPSLNEFYEDENVLESDQFENIQAEI